MSLQTAGSFLQRSVQHICTDMEQKENRNSFAPPSVICGRKQGECFGLPAVLLYLPHYEQWYSMKHWNASNDAK